jgi:AraC-like DNA-binding protein
MIALGIASGIGQETRWWGQRLSSTCIPIARSTGELNVVTAANEAITVLTMREMDFLRIFERLTGLLPCDFPRKGHFLKVRTEAARQALDFWNSTLAQTAISNICEWTVADLVAPLLDALELPFIQHRVETTKSVLLDRLMGVAEVSNFQASVPEISLDLNVSRRTIEYVFQDLIGVSPQAYFTVRRLNLSKQALTEANPDETTVASIATRHGFYELGRFASLYRRYFGELPSITLRRTRGLVAIGVQPDVTRNMMVGSPGTSTDAL